MPSVVLRQILENEATASKRRVFFELDPSETGQGGEQPDISVNGSSWTSSGISTITHIGDGVYYSELDSGTVTSAGDFILTRLQYDTLFFAQGDRVEVVSAAGVGISASDVWNYTGRGLDGDVEGKVLGGGAGSISGVGAWVQDQSGTSVGESVWSYGSDKIVTFVSQDVQGRVLGNAFGSFAGPGVWSFDEDGESIREKVWMYSGRSLDGDVGGKVLGDGAGTIVGIGAYADVRDIYGNSLTSNAGANFQTFFDNATLSSSVLLSDVPSTGGGGGASAADIWAFGTRTLTAAPTGLITANDVWSHATRTLTAAPTGLITASDVWAFGSRTLTGNVSANLVQITGVALNLATLVLGGMSIGGTAFTPMSVLRGSINDAGPTASGFSGDSSLSTSSGIYEKMWLHFMDGPLLGISRVVDSYSGGSQRRFEFTGAVFPSTPASGNGFVLISYTDSN